MNELRELYQEVILDHNRRPRNYGEMEDSTGHSEGFNPLCGDRVVVYVKEENGQVEDIRFKGAGCAISQASASLMTECVKGKSVEDAMRISREFNQMVTSPVENPPEIAEEGESLLPLAGVREFPIRVKCATLAWHTLEEALKGNRNA